jgi:type I restriction enzyme R subunit
VEPPKDSLAYFRYFSAKDAGNAEQLKQNEARRHSLYQLTAALIRAYAAIANEMDEAGYTAKEATTIKAEVTHYEKVRDEVKQHSGDAIDLKRYEPAMRHLIDTYIRAEASEKVSAFDDLSLIQLIVQRGPDAVKALPKGIQSNEQAVAETIENNVRKLIIDEHPINPKYYDRMSDLLDALILERRVGALTYQQYLKKIVDLTRQAVNPTAGATYPASLDTSAKRSIYDNLGRDEALARTVDRAVHESRQDEWRANPVKVKKVRLALKAVLKDDALTDRILDLVKSQRDY